ncbi:hypothetical protein OPQ81_009683 [Rhizoctonia solani]|nr:hypothetical protein OPQ81_009683 [Rhizoctonia solani]
MGITLPSIVIVMRVILYSKPTIIPEYSRVDAVFHGRYRVLEDLLIDGLMFVFFRPTNTSVRYALWRRLE